MSAAAGPATVSHHAAAPAAVVHPMRPADDDGGDSGGDDGGGGTDDGGGFDDGSSGGDTGDNGSSGGDDTGAGSSSGNDNGGGFDTGDSGGDTTGPVDSGPVDGGGGYVPTPVDPGPTDNGDAGDNPAHGGTTYYGDGDVYDGGDYVLLYPTGTYCDNALYDVGAVGYGVTGLPVYARGADFGGTVRARLPAHPLAGDAGVATVRVFNTGVGTAGRFDVVLGVTPDGTAAHAVRVAADRLGVNLGHDRVTSYRIPFRLPATLPAGRYQLLAMIDAGNEFDEQDESDNVALGPSVDVDVGTPDLSVTSVATRRSARAGGRLGVAVHLRNVGTGIELGTATVTVSVSVEPTDGSAAAVVLATLPRRVRLPAGRRATVSVPIPLGTLPAGAYRLTVRVMPADAADVNAVDKSGVTTFTVRPVTRPAFRHRADQAGL